MLEKEVFQIKPRFDKKEKLQRIKIVQMGEARSVIQIVTIEKGYIRYSKYQLMDNDQLMLLDELGLVYK